MQPKRLLVFSSDGKRRRNHFDILSPQTTKEIKFDTIQILQSRSNSVDPRCLSKNIHNYHKEPVTTYLFPSCAQFNKSKFIESIQNEVKSLMPLCNSRLTSLNRTQKFKKTYFRQDVHSIRQKIQQLQRLKKFAIIKDKKNNEIGININGRKAPNYQVEVWKKNSSNLNN